MIRAIIIDDEEPSIDRLKSFMESSALPIELYGSFALINDAIKKLDELQVDVVFLDIEVGEENSFDFLKKMKNRNFEVIFTTAFLKYAIQALKISAVDYLLKPVKREDFDEAIFRLQERLSLKGNAEKIEMLLHNLASQNLHKKISLPTAEGYTFLDIQDIVRCEADVNYTHIFLITGQRITVSKSLKYFDGLLSNFNFSRIHNSHLINLSYVKKYTKGKGGYVTMTDNSKIMVSTRRKEKFLNLLK
ncbi:LytR/AlgR family response regulator transcription factor [Salinimicrobium sp. GXAS 041]|uniref:LytR/AlgR family response regulator transcription factor n=1 Tax=Salinimicrobium sp. GXAS 041 TaxID=3400806 RepID=UPI003C780E1C